VRARTWISCCVSLLLLSCFPLALRAAEVPVCGENDLLFGCTKTEETGRLRAGCGVRDGKRFFASAWRLYDLQTEGVLKEVPAGPEGIALIEIPDNKVSNKLRWLILEGEVVCTNGSGELAIPYRFLVERTRNDRFQQHAYTPESLMATGNWNAETQLHYGEFRSRSLQGAPRAISSSLP
jgi:hypothetical protein